jgi:CheY-like chemotaxis protein
VAKILVADDNSNVQKTVALALADLGVEVVAVNNGDAAVRKLGDIMPDLVLADIFMPVRNGYEVCDYVKKDSRFSHVPVVLLVGAFDPLDEREAQRVAADGILKKPFVPPDPLIAMVKTLLDRSLGERLVTAGAAKPAAAAQNSATGSASAVKVEVRPPAPPAPPLTPVTPEPSHEAAAEEELQTPVDRLSFGEGEHPVAFGQLLDAPGKDSAQTKTEAIEPVDDEQVLTSARDANLGEPVFWKAEDPESETEEGETETEAEDDSDFSSRAWGLDEDAQPSRSHTDVAQPVEPIEPFELVRDQDASASAAPTIVEASSSFAQDAASQASLTVKAGKAEDLAANPIEWMAAATKLPVHEVEEPPEEAETPWSAAELETSDAVEPSSGAEEWQAVPEPVPPPAPPAPAAPLGVMAPASFLGMSVPSAAPPAASPTPPQLKTAAPAPDPAKTQPPFKSLNQNAEDTARSIPKQEWADLAASLQAPPAAPAAEKPKATPPAPVATVVPENSSPASAAAPADPASPDPALVEAVVQRVLDKMRPQVVDIITKEFLRPVVQALVHREISKH